jgi:uncharacterized repeat protein (TIGR01451 family)
MRSFAWWLVVAVAASLVGLGVAELRTYWPFHDHRTPGTLPPPNYYVRAAAGNFQVFTRVVDQSQDPTHEYPADDLKHAITVSPGDQLRYVVNVANQGPTDFSNVHIAVVLPPYLMLVATAGIGSLSDDVGPLGRNAALNITATVRVSTRAPGPITFRGCARITGVGEACDDAVVRVQTP